MPSGSQNGVSNNPAGRPAGAAQKLSISLRTKIVNKVTDDFDDYYGRLIKLSDKDFVRCMTELLKLVVPRPINEDESDALKINSELVKRLFYKSN